MMSTQLRSAVNKVLTHPKLLEITSNLTTAVTDYLRFKIRWDNDRKRRDTETGEDSNTDSAQNELKQPKDNYDDNDDETKCFQLWKDQRKRRLRKNVVAMGNSKPSENKGHPIFCPDRKNSEYSKKHSGGLFVDSLGSAMTAYGPAGVEGNYDEDGNWVRLEQKKNRMGQRARKAKAMAMEAAKKGQRWDSSINWREKNKKKRSHDEKEESSAPSRHKTTSGLDVSTNASAVANMGKKWKETGNAHPSWAARELAKQRTKIIISANPSSSSSSGKRIKFNVDDD
mmetsp:Transcript_9137/g.20184  ORF Transcript_9137/g.20184 Transcript_9137/m.20184 type:complete len:284 (-) Transcript_9137:260-1111(-)